MAIEKAIQEIESLPAKDVSDVVSPETKVIVYNHQTKLARVIPFEYIQGVPFQSYPLPNNKQQLVPIGDPNKNIDLVNLGNIGPLNKLRRWQGCFERIYAINAPSD
ncbi:hypothetical protein MMC11_007590 [Xylographa trunciseda]|nr:hypothetical protein [Xylographa trunciseda]